MRSTILSFASGLLLVAAAAMSSSCCQSAQEPKPINIAVFAEHIQVAARQSGLTLREAGQKFRDLGYEGVDVDMNISQEDMDVLDELGFAHAAVHAHILFSDGEQEELSQKCIDFMVKNHFDKVLLVPGFFVDQPTDEEWDIIISRASVFAKKAAEAGIDVMLEDYDNKRSPTYNVARLDKMFKAIPDLNFVYDSGNFCFAGEGVLVALDHFKPMVHHVHLKDRIAYRDLSPVAVGGGILPITEIVNRLQASGYEGWFTVEQFGSPRMLEDAEYSIKTLKGLH